MKSTANGKIVDLRDCAGSKARDRACEMPDDFNLVVSDLLRKMESDVAKVVASNAPPAKVNQQQVDPSSFGVSIADVDRLPEGGGGLNTSIRDSEGDDIGLPRVFQKPTDAVGRQASPEDDIEQYKSAALRGFGLGLLIVIPAVVWVTFSVIAPGQKTPAKSNAPVVAAATGVSAEVFKAHENSAPALTPDDAMRKAARLIKAGQVSSAQAVLEKPELAAIPSIVMALAETFDPQMLAAWGVKGARADVAKARHYYKVALSLGVSRAKNRLEMLK